MISRYLKVPDLDKKTRYRLRSTAVGYADGLIAIVLLAGYAWAGTITYQLPLQLFLAQVLCEALFIAAIVSGASKRFSDPSLTAHQIGAGCGANVVVLLCAPQLLHFVLANMFVTLSFGSFRFNRRSFFMTGCALAAVIAAAVWFVHDGIRIPVTSNAEVLLLFISIGVGMGRFMLINARVSELRAALHEKNRRLEHLASHDSLTALWNRRRFMEFLEEERQRCLRTGEVFSVAIIDVDHFKSVNDMFGHLAGDQVLKEVAVLLENAHRAADTVGRYGGEEFTMLLVQAENASSHAVLERMRATVELHRWDNVAEGLRVTVSAGSATWNPGESINQTLRRADKALYEAKNGGRNRVCHAGPRDALAKPAGGMRMPG